MLKIESLSYSIAGHQVLDKLCFEINEGQYFAIAGENGAGKTTLIKIILDLIQNTTCGIVTIKGVSNGLLSSRNELTYLPEKFDLKREATGWQYLKFIFSMYSEDENRGKVLKLCERLSLDAGRLNDKINGYSKGMKQKIGLIGCFMLNKPLVILDEPLSGLDPKARYYFKQLLTEERKNNRTIFYSTHMLADAEEICDLFGILHQGEMKFVGTPSACIEAYDAKNLEEAYIKCISGT